MILSVLAFNYRGEQTRPGIPTAVNPLFAEVGKNKHRRDPENISQKSAGKYNSTSVIHRDHRRKVKAGG